jgi:hypothetical protein
MATALKCPNPNCNFLFDPTQVPVGAILCCPQCEMRFTLGPPPPLPQQPQPPIRSEFEPTKSLASPPILEHTAIQHPPTSQVTTESPKPAAPEPPKKPRRAVPNATPFPWGTLVGILAVVATAIAVGAYLFQQLQKGGSFASATNYDERNISYRFPNSWVKDDEVRSLLSGNLFGLRQSDGPAIAALEARDYKSRNAQPGELKEGCESRLKPLLEDLDLRETDEVTWAGQKATRSLIRGNALPKLGTGAYVGEIYAMTHKGVAYWFVALVPESQAAALAGELPVLLERMQFLNVRDDWKPTTSAVFVLAGREADYRLSDGDGWWKPLGDPKFEDANADQVYDAEFRFKTKVDRKPKARVAVLNLAFTQNEPITILREYVKEQYRKQLDLKDWLEVSDAPQGDWPPSGEQRVAATFRYEVTGPDPKRAKFVVISALKMDVNTEKGREPRVIGVHASCAWEDRHYWEKRLIQMATSLRPAGS